MERMEKEFVDYKIALELKELGFDEPCIAGYSNSTEKLEFYSRPLVTKDSFTVDAPTYLQAFRWFRDVHKLWAYQIPWSGNMYAMTIYRLLEDSETVKTMHDRVIMNTWEEAEIECLIKLIEIVKQK